MFSGVSSRGCPAWTSARKSNKQNSTDRGGGRAAADPYSLPTARAEGPMEPAGAVVRGAGCERLGAGYFFFFQFQSARRSPHLLSAGFKQSLWRTSATTKSSVISHQRRGPRTPWDTSRM